MRRGAIIVACALALTGCGELFDPAAAVVHGEKITVAEVEEDLERFEESSEFERLSQQGDPQAFKREVEQQILTQLIRRSVLAPEAERLEVEVTEDDVSARLEEIQSDFPSQGAFEEALKEQGLSMAQLRELVFDSLVENALKERVTAEARPSEDQVTSFYKANRRDFRQTRAQHILVDDKNKAASIARQLRSAPRSQVDKLFGQLAKRFSTDESNAGKRGDLGYFSSGDFVAPFEKAAAKLEMGAISSPVKTEFGFHVIRVTDRRVAPLEEVRRDIEAELLGPLQDRVWTRFLRDAYRSADVKVNPRYGELDPSTFQVVDATAKDIPGAEEPSPEATPAISPTG